MSLLAAGAAALIVDAVLPPAVAGDRLWLATAGSTLVGLGCAGTAVARVRHLGPLPGLRLGPSFAVYYALAFGVFSLGWLARQRGSAAIVDPLHIPQAVVITSFGLVAWLVGYLVGFGAGVQQLGEAALRRAFRPGRWTLRFPSVAVFMYVLGSGARAIRLWRNSFAYLQNPSAALSNPSSFNAILAMIEGFAKYGLVVAAIDAFALSRSARSRLVLGVLFLIELVVSFFSGSKEAVILSVLSVAIVAAFATSRVSRRAVVGAVLAILIVFPSTAAYRRSIRTTGTTSVATGTALHAVPSTLIGTIEGFTPRQLFVNTPSAIARRLREIDNVALVQQKTPSAIQYRPWTELFYGPVVGLVPRVVWPNKPVLSTGEAFSVQYYELPTTLFTASAITVPGDLYRHGGVLPLLVGLLILGQVIRLIDEVCNPSRDLRYLLVFVPLYSLLLQSETDVIVLIVGLIQACLVLAVASKIAFTRLASPGRTAAIEAETIPQAERRSSRTRTRHSRRL